MLQPPFYETPLNRGKLPTISKLLEIDGTSSPLSGLFGQLPELQIENPRKLPEKIRVLLIVGLEYSLHF